MSNGTTDSNGYEIGMLEAQGGGVSYEDFYKLVAQLEKARALDHINPLLLAALPSLGEFDVIYIILRKGYKPDLDENYSQLYTHTTDKDGASCWLAGFAGLLFPVTRRHQCGDIAQKLNDGSGDTADIGIALLPVVQKQGYGRVLIQRLANHAFNTLRIPRLTASVMCPVQSSHSMTIKKQVVHNSKQLCWIFEKFGFTFEGISRGAAMGGRFSKDGKPVWHDVYRLSMLQTDHFDRGRSYFLSHTCSTHKRMPTRIAPQSPWESMIQRQEEEKRDVESWNKKPEVQIVSVNDACDSDSGGSEDETVDFDD